MTNESQNRDLFIKGMEVIKSEENGLYYFHYNDKYNRYFLFSQPYHSARSRDQGMESLLKNARDASHYVALEEGGQHLFAIRGGNHQEIARSRPFATAEERDAAMQALQAAWSGKPAKVAAAAKAVEELNPSHYRFILSFYPEPSGVGLRSKIEYPISKDDKESFEGLDLERIGRFIQERLPQAQKAEKKAPLPKVVGIPISRPLEVIEAGQPFKGQRVARDKKLELQLPLSAEEIRALEGKALQTNLWIKPMEKGVDSIAVQRRGISPVGKTIKVEAPVHDLEAGLYRFTLRVEPESQEREAETLEGSSLLLVS